MATWPATLPQEMLKDGYARSAGDNVIRSSMDAGPGKARRRFTAVAKPMVGSVLLTDAQLAIFKGFYADDLLDGSLRFDWVDQDDQATAIECRFTSAPNWVPRGLRWLVSLELEILP